MYKQLGRRFWGYTYQEMEKDLEIFARAFSETMKLKTLGKTADKREIYCFILGRADAGEKIFLFGAIHGREYMTSQLLMEQTAEFLTKLYREETYKGYSYKELLEGKAVYVVPMANPDGVTISQQGPRGLRDPQLQKQVWKIGEREGGRMPCGPYYRRWKANARGVDLNRNFQAFWEEYHDLKGQPSREGYKGQAPEDQEESKVLAELTRQENSKGQSAIILLEKSFTGILDKKENSGEYAVTLGSGYRESQDTACRKAGITWIRQATRTGP